MERISKSCINIMLFHNIGIAIRRNNVLQGILVFSSIIVMSFTVNAANGVTFTNVADNVYIGVSSYVRTPTPELINAVNQFRNASLVEPLPLLSVAEMPSRPYGMPGIAIFDYNRDGDLDIYVTNGPGTPNSLFDNQLANGGSFTFIDVAASAGVTATAQKSSGVCYGDIDNDGDDDLFVMGLVDSNKLFENNGDGTFNEAVNSGIEGGLEASGSCNIGDVDNDGLLDLIVANSHDPLTSFACFAVPFEQNQHNQLYINQGNNTFVDESAARGIENQFIPGYGFQPGITWTTASADIDLDGDIDILFGDDQCGFPHSGRPGPTGELGIDRGFIHVMINDGTGNFTDLPIINNGNGSFGQNKGVGYHMGTGLGDLNCDGNMDLFVSNIGDYNFSTVGVPYNTGDAPTRWQLGNDDGTFTDQGVGSLNTTPFGWGNAVLDYDNDGDQDLVSLGGLDSNFILWIDNPGMLLENNGCTADFGYDSSALSTDYTTLNTQGLAIGDLNRDGFVDIVTTTNWAVPLAPRIPSPNNNNSSPFDATALFVPIFAPIEQVPPFNNFVWTGNDVVVPNVGITMEINNRGNNGSATFTTIGSINITKKGTVNRSGIGAVLFFTPDGGSTVMSPVTGGSSFISQHALETYFGLGDKAHGTVEVLWPGGVRNRLYNVSDGENLALPEIPCTYVADFWKNKGEYTSCVMDSLNDLEMAGIINVKEKSRYLISANKAFNDQ